MADPRVWTFTQLAGPQKQLTLTGWSAPFGRQRRAPLMNAGTSVRRTTTFYSGKNVPGTVHTFGTLGKPFEIHGRWMDPQIGGSGGTQNGAQILVRDWKEFVNDSQIVRAQWGEIISFKIFFHDFDAFFEDPANVQWALKADVLQDEFGQITSVSTTAASPSDIASQMQAMLKASNPFTPSSYGTLRGLFSTIADDIDQVVALINTPAAVIFDTCSALSDFETAVSSDLGTLLSSVQTVRSGTLQLQDANWFIVNNALELDLQMQAQFGVGLFGGDALSKMTEDAAASEAANTNLLALMSDLQDQCDLAQRGQTKSAFRASDGDTWESVAVRQYGSASAARKIKALNGIRYGTRPVSGQVYQLPTSG